MYAFWVQGYKLPQSTEGRTDKQMFTITGHCTGGGHGRKWRGIRTCAVDWTCECHFKFRIFTSLGCVRSQWLPRAAWSVWNYCVNVKSLSLPLYANCVFASILCGKMLAHSNHGDVIDTWLYKSGTGMMWTFVYLWYFSTSSNLHIDLHHYYLFGFQ